MGTVVRSLLDLSKRDLIWNLGMNKFKKLKLYLSLTKFFIWNDSTKTKTYLYGTLPFKIKEKTKDQPFFIFSHQGNSIVIIKNENGATG